MANEYTTLEQTKQCTNLLNVLNNQEFHDVNFIIGPNKSVFGTNRVFLSSISPVFKAMLYGRMQESKQNAEIEINDIDPIAFKSVLSYAHCNNPKLNANNIIPVRHICDKYQISSLAHFCDKYFESCIDAKNVCFLLNGAINMKLDVYITKCTAVITNKLGEFADQIVKSKGFIEMSLDAMKIFLKLDQLNIKEEDLWQYILKWVDNQIVKNSVIDGEPAKKKQKLNNGNSNNNNKNSDVAVSLLKAVCPFIRFGLMDGKYFVKKVKSQNCLTVQEIADILCYIQCNDEKGGKFSTKPRKCKKCKLSLIPLSVGVGSISPPNNLFNILELLIQSICAGFVCVFRYEHNSSFVFLFDLCVVVVCVYCIN